MRNLRSIRSEPGCLWSIAGAMLGLVMVLIILIVTRLQGVGNSGRSTPTAVLIVIANPSSTPNPTPSLTPMGTVTPTASPTPSVQLNPDFDIGVLVEVFGTEGDGLRIRTQPNLAAEIRFLGLDHEVFRVVSGPVESGGYRWWLLENPFDESKTGWAVDLFLQPASNP
jgi:hypothetical protein